MMPQVDEHDEHVSQDVPEIHPKLQATRKQAEPVPGHMRAPQMCLGELPG